MITVGWREGPPWATVAINQAQFGRTWLLYHDTRGTIFTKALGYVFEDGRQECPRNWIIV